MPLLILWAGNRRTTFSCDAACCLVMRKVFLRDVFFCTVAFLAFRLLYKLRNDIVKVSHDPDVCDLEYRRVRILDTSISVLFPNR